MNKTKGKGFMLVPSAPGVCQECARNHDPDQPHNQQSLHYQYSFYARHGRWPTWADAMAHCSEEIQQAWKAELKNHGIEV